jgi:hypothetical protein
MPTTYEAIATVTVGSGGAANIEFTSIPATFTDLAISLSGRSAGTAPAVMINFNNSTSNFSQKRIQSDGSSVASYGTYAQIAGLASISSATASTFGSTFIYIPNYAGSTNKSYSSDAVTENNGTLAYMELIAGLWSNTSAITSIKLYPDSSQNWAQYSTATLYGIKNS